VEHGREITEDTRRCLTSAGVIEAHYLYGAAVEENQVSIIRSGVPSAVILKTAR
jgi:hypothetical protein